MKKLIKFSFFKLKGATGPYYIFNHNVDGLYRHMALYYVGEAKTEQRISEHIRLVIDHVVKELNIKQDEEVTLDKMPEIKFEFSEKRFMKAALIREKIVKKEVFLKFEEEDYAFFEKIFEAL